MTVSTSPLVRRGNRLPGHSGNQIRLLPQGLPSSKVRRLAGDDFRSVKQARENRDIARGFCRCLR